ncbi:MAG: 30S ribosomal protein S27e [Methanobacteriota archaeon]|nr:MAG: 30S ribosomal protein S27e [Euryarchaeota archaeon]
MTKIGMKPSKTFARVKCPECEKETIVFISAKTTVRCLNEECNTVLAVPRGGKAEIKGEIVELLS